MVRLSDFAGKQPQEEPKPDKPKSPGPFSKREPEQAVRLPDAPPAATETFVRKPASVSSSNMEAGYEALLSAAAVLSQQVSQQQPLQLAPLVELLNALPKPQTGQCEQVFRLSEQWSEQPYPCTHAVNTALLSYYLAARVGQADAALQAALMTGMVMEFAHSKEMSAALEHAGRSLGDEWRAIMNRPAAVTHQLKVARSQASQAIALFVVGQEKMAEECTKIVALCSVYDMLIHPKSSRKPISPAKVIKLLIEGVEDTFDRKVVKALVDELSLYPRGSRVRLNTNELGVVERVHPQAPLRPVVLVVQDADHHPLGAPRLINLSEHPLIYIKEVVSEESS